MKIVIIANSSKGLYGFRQELIAALLKENKVCAYTQNNGSVEELIELGCGVKELNIDRRGIDPVKDFNLIRTIKKILKIEKPDLVITYTIKPNIYGGMICRLLNIPYAINITGLGTAFQNNGLLKTIVAKLYKIALKNARVVFFENEENRQIFIREKIVKESQTHRLNGAGVNLERYQVAEYPLGDRTKFLFMGRVMAEKGIDDLFAAMRRLLSDGVNCELDVLGGYEEDYKDKIEQGEKEGWLHYWGYQKDVKPFIEAAHCFVLPSWHEGMANTNLESASSGRPVITTNIHGCLEAVEDGVTGYLVEKKNSDDLYRAMKTFAGLSFEKRKEMGLAGRKRMEKLFDKKNVVENTISRL